MEGVVLNDLHTLGDGIVARIFGGEGYQDGLVLVEQNTVLIRGEVGVVFCYGIGSYGSEVECSIADPLDVSRDKDVMEFV